MVCAGVPATAGVDGAGITVMGSLAGGLEGARDQVAATGPVSRRLEELQLTVGEGPCLDAYATGMPVLVADLASGFTPWLAFAPEAQAAGASAVFSLPLQVGAVRLGTLDLYRSRPGDLSREQLAAALAVAETATELLLENSDPDADPGEDVGWLSGVHADVHIASGVVSVQSGVDVGAALLRLRAYAFAHAEPLHEVARRVIEHTLVLAGGNLDDDPPEPPDDRQPAPDPEDDDR
ncbi:GAF and ANTAR domain-containing protein [Actinomycetospora atypica]|uniref:GAF and ANTAR domain-containing protein n=1 Tax=Actinomycetospora atypica TaxID=1290095 RepID=A0ABV9YKM3_9PSEU